MRRVARIVDTLAEPRAVRAAFRWAPFSISAFRLVGAVQRVLPELDTVIDGGANVGQFSRAALEFYPGARVVAFEPNPGAAESLRSNIQGTNRFTLRRMALGDRCGEIAFNVNEYSHASSVLPIAQEALDAFPVLGATREEVVPLSTLDAEFPDPEALGKCLLKLDLQGYELKALAGAGVLLRHVDAILLEASITSMYEGEPALEELQAKLLEFDLVVRAIPDVLLDIDGHVAQLDVLFTRRS